MTYQVEVVREDDAWIADVIDLPGAHTYARNLTALNAAVQEVIALVADLPDDADRPAVHYVYKNVDANFLAAAKLGEAREQVEAQRRDLGIAAELVVMELADGDYSVRDISGALKMSPGRVSQIMKARRARARL